LAAAVFRSYSAKPERLREIAQAQKETNTIAIDEVQKITELLDVLHQVMEQYKEYIVRSMC
jgi:predicted AAA+ superfamily ATPase